MNARRRGSLYSLRHVSIGTPRINNKSASAAKLPQLGKAHATAVIRGAIDPSVGESVTVEHLPNEAGRMVKRVRVALGLPIVCLRPVAHVLDIIDVVSQCPKAEQVMKIGPGLTAGDRSSDRACYDNDQLTLAEAMASS